MRDFRRFACIDIFHRAVRMDGREPRAGAEFVLEHGLAGFNVSRVGRILSWDDGRSYVFSDLSRRGPRAGFPHVYTYELIPGSVTSCRFRLGVRGLWTARLLPRFVVRSWLTWILLKIRSSAYNAFLQDGLRRRAVGGERSRRSEAECAPSSLALRTRGSPGSGQIR